MKKLLLFLKRRRALLIGIVVVLAAGVITTIVLTKRTEASDFITQKLERGTIEVTVSATGTVQAVTTVQVGSQVSGTVSWLGADFNSKVSRGQLVAKLDPAIFQTQVDNAQANVLNSQAAVKTATADLSSQQASLDSAKANQEVARVQRDDAIALLKRNQALVNVLSGREIEAAQAAANAAAAKYTQAGAQVGQAQAAIDSAKAKLEQAKASVAQSKAQLDQAKVNLAHTIIASPIDGVVVSRTVDVGQTVAASLQAPTLFTIANDLTKMQVLGSIDEADVGQIREGIRANFTVDAYHGDVFNGTISQIRLNAQALQNVVTYTAVIDVSNPELKLRPGMTANLTIPIAKRENVLMLPNAALRFRPNLSEKEQAELNAKIEAMRQQREAERQAAKDQGAENQPKEEGAPAEETAQAPAGNTANANRGGAEHKQRHGEGNQGSGMRAGGEGRKGNGNWHGRREGGASEGGGSDANSNGGRSGMHRGEHAREGGDANSNGGSHRGGRRDGANSNAEGHARRGEGGRDKASGSEGGSASGNNAMKGNGSNGSMGGGSRDAGGQGGGRGEGGSRRQQGQIVYVLTVNKKLEPRFVRLGITNGRFTEIISGDLQEGDIIVTGQNDTSGARPPQANTTNPLQPRPPMGGGGRGR